MQVQSRQGEGKNSTGDGEAKELICPTHRRELRGEGMRVGEGVQAEGYKWGRNGTAVTA